MNVINQIAAQHEFKVHGRVGLESTIMTFEELANADAPIVFSRKLKLRKVGRPKHAVSNEYIFEFEDIPMKIYLEPSNTTSFNMVITFPTISGDPRIRINVLKADEINKLLEDRRSLLFPAFERFAGVHGIKGKKISARVGLEQNRLAFIFNGAELHPFKLCGLKFEVRKDDMIAALYHGYMIIISRFVAHTRIPQIIVQLSVIIGSRVQEATFKELIRSEEQLEYRVCEIKENINVKQELRAHRN